MRGEGYAERIIEVEGWPVRIASYKLGPAFHATADNVSPGATLARASAATRADAEGAALDRARQLLARTRRRAV
jgi:hypothetical protein